jgi:steroid 5-alpha reductase family enzyme
LSPYGACASRGTWRSLFIVFWLQAALLWIVALPIWRITTAIDNIPLGLFDLLGTASVVVGVGFEAIGDAQLARFKRDAANRGRVLQTGLWRCTRHPNYFDDALVWWISGVTLLESAMAQRPGYRDYVARTNAFVPWFPRPADQR